MALPCIVCGKELQDVDDDCENQPNKGLAFGTHGHYGSHAFDPMDGRFLEINVCDECLLAAAKQRRILLGQDRKLVAIPGPKEWPFPHVIGTTPVNRSLVEWNPEASDEEDELIILDDFEEYERWAEKIDTVFTRDELKEMFNEV